MKNNENYNEKILFAETQGVFLKGKWDVEIKFVF